MVRISFTGDIMSSPLQNRVCFDGKNYDYRKAFQHLDFKATDYLCGNLETPIAGEDLKYSFTPTQFNTPESFIEHLHASGFHFMSMANNHVMDRGKEGLLRTINALNRVGIDYTGIYKTKEDSNKIFIKKFGGLRVSFLSFTYGTNAEDHHRILQNDEDYMIDLLRAQPEIQDHKEQKLSINQIVRKAYRVLRNTYGKIKSTYNKEIKQDFFCGSILDCVSDDNIDAPRNKKYIDRLIFKIRKAKKLSDITVLCLHIGGQYNNDIGEYTKYIFNLLSQEDIDIIIGNHPHCVLGSKWDGKRLITYSLGNFTFTPRNGWYNFDVFADYSILLHIDIDEGSKKIESCSFSILKIIREQNDLSTTHFLFDLINSEKDANKKELLARDNYEVIRRFTGREIFDIAKEYRL